MTENKPTCYQCQKQLDLEPGQKILRHEECTHCYASLRCCKMCQFYDTSAYNECREPMAERILDKEKANFCDFFVLQGGGNSGKGKDDLLKAANDLFKD